MLKKMMFLCASVFVFLLSGTVAFAHQPQLVWDVKLAAGVPLPIENPEVSKAYYGNLRGEPDYYVIDAKEPFALYVNALVPDIDGVYADISLTIEKDGEFFYYVDGIDAEWVPFYEKFGGDDYYKGAEYKVDAESGKYVIKVSSLENEGKYVLAVGEKEEFGVSEILQTLADLPTLKSDFFGKSAWTAYFNMIGVYVGGSLVLVLGLFILCWYLISKYLTSRKYAKKA